MKDEEFTPQDPMPITREPKNIMIAVAGGLQSGHAYYMHVGCCPNGPSSATINLPAKANWDALLVEAEGDLGPVPDF